ncbi:MAG: thioredoxin family protein [Vallitalea sp.]|jgi:small redox-active disulfide protein 2|nr:thioredoxin family protein [Vallitalea sp.]
MVIKILGGGCKNCQILHQNTLEALKELDIQAEVIKVQEMKDIMAYGVMKTPALVVDEDIKVMGRVPKVKEIVKVLGE